MLFKHRTHGVNAHSLLFGKSSIALFSYETMVAVAIGQILYIDEFKYSRTTLKHITQYAPSRSDIRYVSHETLQFKLQHHIANTLLEDIDLKLLS